MVENLTVKDFALIDYTSTDFDQGFTVFSGETGAGKSILIGALSFLLGAKAGAEVIRNGMEEARVSGSIFVPETALSAKKWLFEKNIELENNRLLLRRIIKTNGRSGIWIQDIPVTRAELVEFTSFLVDIHGQHEHQSLLKIDEHRKFLDSYALILEEVALFTTLYTELAMKRSLYDEMNSSEKERQRSIELLTFTIQEISTADLKLNEDNDLEAEENRLTQYEKLYSSIDVICDSLSSSEGIVSLLKKTRHILEAAVQIDSSLQNSYNRIETDFYDLEDISQSLVAYKDSLEFNPVRLQEIQERLSLIYRLKKKYGSSIAEIQASLFEAQQQLEQMTGWDENKSVIEEEIRGLEKKVYSAGISISTKRKEASLSLQTSVVQILQSLGMNGTRFYVSIEAREGSETMQRSGPYGFDTIEFLISPNVGEPLRPLAKIASGGELSRVMLALKTVLADADETNTLIFDEIDTGIGGEVALAVGRHLRELSKRKQIVCITHLASIAVQADNQVKIEKKFENGKTVTCVFPVTAQKRIEEIARMLAGDGFSAASMKHAEEMLSSYATL